MVPDGTYDCTGQSRGKSYALTYLQGFSGLHLTRFRVSPDHCRVGITVDSTRSGNTLHFVNALWGIVSASDLSSATISTGYDSRTLVVELASMPDLPTRVHLDSLLSIAGCVESQSRVHTGHNVMTGSSLASGWGGPSASASTQGWSQPPPGPSQTSGACWDCARGLCLRLDHGSSLLPNVKVSNTPAHSATSGDQGHAPVYQGTGLPLGTSNVPQGPLLDLSTRSRLPTFTDTPATQALHVPAVYPGGTMSHSDVSTAGSVTSQPSRPPSPMDSQSYPQASGGQGTEVSMDTQTSSAVSLGSTSGVPSDLSRSEVTQAYTAGTGFGLSNLTNAPAASGLPWPVLTSGPASVTDTFTTLTPIPAPIPIPKMLGAPVSTPSVTEGGLPPISYFLSTLPELSLQDTKATLGDTSGSSATAGYAYSPNNSQDLPSPPLGIGPAPASDSGSLIDFKPVLTYSTSGPLGPSTVTSSPATVTLGSTTTAGAAQQIPGVAVASTLCNLPSQPSTSALALSSSTSGTAPTSTSVSDVATSGVTGAPLVSNSDGYPGSGTGIEANHLGVLADVALLYGGPEPSSSNAFSRRPVRHPSSLLRSQSPPPSPKPSTSGNPSQGLEGLAIEVVSRRPDDTTGATSSDASHATHPGTVSLPTPMTPVEIVRQVLFQKLVIFRLGVLHTAMPVEAAALLSRAETELQSFICASCPLTCIYCAFRGLHQLVEGSATQYLGMVIPEPQGPSWTVELELVTVGPSPVKVKFTIIPHQRTTLLQRLLAWRLYPQEGGDYIVHNPSMVLSPSGTLHPVALATPPTPMKLTSRWYVMHIHFDCIVCYVCMCSSVSWV